MPGRVLGQGQVLELCALCREVAVAEPVLRYAARLVGQSTPDARAAPPLVKRAVRFGPGVRGAQSLILAAKAVALIEGRGHVSFGDVQRTAKPVLRHRILRSFEGEADGISTDQIVEELIKTVPTLPENVEQVVQGS
jgi:MoxR-like ATPase